MAETREETKTFPLVIDCETTGLDTHKDKVIGVSYHLNGNSYYQNEFPAQGFDKTAEIICHNGKFDAEIIASNFGFTPKVSFDTQVAYYLLHIDRPKKLEKIVKDLFNINKEDLIEVYNRVTGKKRKSLPVNWHEDIPEHELGVYAQEDVEYTYKIYEYCKEQLDKKPHLKKWFYDVEMPLVNILIQSELKGVRVDVAKLKAIEAKLERTLNDIDRKLRILAGKQDINFNSSKQLQEVLYKNMKLPKFKKTKTGYSTDTKTLEKLAVNDGFCRLLLQYRGMQKLLTAFVKPLQDQADEYNRIHAWFSQMGTKTRRMSCKNPNLQQIPSKSDIGQEVRKCFIPADGHKFLICDYSQIELRLLAHFSEEPKLIKAFHNGEDIHAQTAEYISKKLSREFDRRNGKILNFSIIYGKTSFGFAQDWGCSRQEAEEILQAYFGLYPRVKEWIREQEDRCKLNNGWIETIGGLPLHVKNINSNDKWLYEEAKRQAVNYLIQGSSQDILKTAVVNIANDLGLVPVLMVHDELVYELHDSVIGDKQKMVGISKGYETVIADHMENAWKLKVPMTVDYKVSSWWEK